MKAYILKLSFNDMQPTVWRQFIMPENATFKRLFDTIMNVTNFNGSHLFRFEASSLIVTNDEALLKASKRKGYEGKPVKSQTAKIDAHVEEGPITFTYDFGDCWEMKIELEKVVDDYYFGYPTLLAMEGVAPPENAGGVEGYKNYLQAISNPKHPMFLQMHEWTDAIEYRPRHFDQINDLLKNVKYGKTEWSALKHDKYTLLEDAYRRAELYHEERVNDSKEVANYIMACANLYGYLPMYKFLIIYNDHHDGMLTATDVEVVATSEMYRDSLRQANITVYMDAIVHNNFDENSNNETYFSRSFGKPYYMPSRKKLLKYAQTSYVEETPAIVMLTKLLERDLEGRTSLTEKLMHDLVQALRSEPNFSDTVKQFITHLPIKNTLQLNIYIELITNVANSCRLWINRGYTPAELSAFEKGDVAPIKLVKKVGRNDKCPCGSGKKYKKCCSK